jgi:hypothetical protein
VRGRSQDCLLPSEEHHILNERDGGRALWPSPVISPHGKVGGGVVTPYVAVAAYADTLAWANVICSTLPTSGSGVSSALPP